MQRHSMEPFALIFILALFRGVNSQPPDPNCTYCNYDSSMFDAPPGNQIPTGGSNTGDDYGYAGLNPNSILYQGPALTVTHSYSPPSFFYNQKPPQSMNSYYNYNQPPKNKPMPQKFQYALKALKAKFRPGPPPPTNNSQMTYTQPGQGNPNQQYYNGPPPPPNPYSTLPNKKVSNSKSSYQPMSQQQMGYYQKGQQPKPQYGMAQPPMMSPPMTGPSMMSPPMTGPSMMSPPMTGPPMTGPSMTGPPMTGPSMMSPPMTGPPMTGPSMMSPPMTGPSMMSPPMTGPSMMSPPMTGPPMTGPSMMSPPMTGPSMMPPPVTNPPMMQPPPPSKKYGPPPMMGQGPLPSYKKRPHGPQPIPIQSHVTHLTVSYKGFLSPPPVVMPNKPYGYTPTSYDGTGLASVPASNYVRRQMKPAKPAHLSYRGGYGLGKSHY